jgi:hypothetical protein
MTNVYIKSFARPFYLDRCIRSIRFNLQGYDRIVVLDDGTERAHLDRIRALHPDVEIRSSGADDGKMALLREEKFSEIAERYPSAPRFWVAEIDKDPHDYTLVLEDDAWLSRHVDLTTLVPHLAEKNTAICKLWWSNPAHHVTERSAAPLGPGIEFFAMDNDLAEAARTIWIVAFALFRRDYWLSAVSQAKRLGDERSQFAAALSFAAAHPGLSFAKTERRCVHQGWAVPARSTPEYYGKKLIQHRFMDALNAAWMDGDLSPLHGYPQDFPTDMITSILSRGLADDDVRAWQAWHAADITYYYD